MAMKRKKAIYMDTWLRLLAFITTLVLAASILTACGSKPEEPEEPEPLTGWDYFESFNPIGMSYEDIEGEYEELIDSGTADGGVLLQVNGEDLYFGFPALTKEDIAPDAVCTSVYGNLKTVFGITSDYTAEKLEDILGVFFEEDYDGMLLGEVTVDSGTYYVMLYNNSFDELLTPEAGIAVFRKEI